MSQQARSTKSRFSGSRRATWPPCGRLPPSREASSQVPEAHDQSTTKAKASSPDPATKECGLKTKAAVKMKDLGQQAKKKLEEAGKEYRCRGRWFKGCFTPRRCSAPASASSACIPVQHQKINGATDPSTKLDEQIAASMSVERSSPTLEIDVLEGSFTQENVGRSVQRLSERPASLSVLHAANRLSAVDEESTVYSASETPVAAEDEVECTSRARLFIGHEEVLVPSAVARSEPTHSPGFNESQALEQTIDPLERSQHRGISNACIPISAAPTVDDDEPMGSYTYGSGSEMSDVYRPDFSSMGAPRSMLATPIRLTWAPSSAPSP